MTDHMAPLVSLMSPLLQPQPGHKFVFAYDHYMDEGRFRTRCPGLRLITTARLLNRSLLFNDQGQITVKREQGGVVLGVIWQISESEQADLEDQLQVPRVVDRFGAFARGPNGQMIATEFYASRNCKPGVAEPIDLVRMFALCREHRFPEAYVDEITMWAWPTLSLDDLMKTVH